MRAILILAACIASANLGVTDACSSCRLGDDLVESGSKWLSNNCGRLNECIDGMVITTGGFQCPENSHCADNNCECDEHYIAAVWDMGVVTSCIKDPNYNPPKCPEDWYLIGSTCYKMFYELRDWYQAERACVTLGGHLASPQTEDVNYKLQELCKATGESFWFGLNDIGSEGNFGWVSNKKKTTYSFWPSWEPNGKRVENCVHYNKKYDKFQWNDTKCKNKFGYICEAPLDSCSEGWYYYKGQCYKKFEKLLPWMGADRYCRYAQGGHLAKVVDVATNDFLKEKAGPNTLSYWIAYNDREQENNFVWEGYNEQSNFNLWSDRQPDNSGNEDCVHVVPQNGFKWNDIKCNANYIFFCQRNPGPAVLPCYDGWSRYNGQCYKMIDEKLTWEDAKESCKYKYGGQLTTIRNGGTNVFIKDQARKQPANYWIGGNDKSTEGIFSWLGSTVEIKFASWMKDQPDNWKGVEHCVLSHQDFNYNWSDKPCSQKHFYSCQRPPGFVEIPCYGGWRKYNGLCYGLISDKKNWFEARAACEHEYGGHLTVIKDERTNTFLKEYASQKVDNYWLAFNDRKKENSFVAFDGTNEMTFTDWIKDQPDNWLNEDCIHLHKEHDLGWNDHKCSSKFGFSCQREPGLIVTSCEDGWDSHNGKCFKEFTVKKTYEEARAACSYHNGYLVEIFDKETNDFVQTMAKKKQGDYWIGLIRKKAEKIFAWENSDTKMTSSVFSSWGTGEPNNYGGHEDCSGLYQWKKYFWNDFKCDSKLNYICQRERGVLDKVKCPAGSSFYEDSLMCYTFSTAEPKSWSGANAVCEGKHGELAEIYTEGLNKHIIHQIKKHPQDTYWIGANDRASEKKFVWNQASRPLRFKFWSYYEPNNYKNGEDCVEIKGHPPYKWNDVACDGKRCFICQCYLYDCVSFNWSMTGAYELK